MAEPTRDPGFWSAVATAALAQGAAVWMLVRNLRSKDKKTQRELDLQAEEQNFTHEERLRQRIDTLETQREEDHRTLWGLQKDVLTLTGQLNTALAENADLRRQNEELAKEATARQAMTDTQLADLRSSLLEANQQRRTLTDEVEALRARLLTHERRCP